MKCDYCAPETKGEILHDDGDVIVAMKEAGMAAGQITVFPKKHFTILEMVPREILAQCAVLANAAGIAVFEALGVGGTNVLIRNGLAAGQKVPHFAIEVVPRRDDDNLQLHWQPQKLMDDEMEEAFAALKKALEKKEERVESEEQEEHPAKDPKSNYLLRSLKRIP